MNVTETHFKIVSNLPPIQMVCFLGCLNIASSMLLREIKEKYHNKQLEEEPEPPRTATVSTKAVHGPFNFRRYL